MLQEGNVLDQHVTEIKTECKDDLISEMTFAEVEVSAVYEMSWPVVMYWLI